MDTIDPKAQATGKLKHIYKEIKKNWRYKKWWEGRIVHYLVGTYYRKLTRNKGKFIINEDWDNLIILDACRYDLFTEVTGVKSNYIISRGSATVEFLRENFANRKFDNIVYITANPFVNIHCQNSFYKIISVWNYDWDEKIGTVLPERMVQYALRAEEEYPDKRLIIHFIQPHNPYIKDPEIARPSNKNVGETPSPWEEVIKGNLSLERVYDAYRRNLEAVVPHAFELAKILKGKTVITSDHGEAFNEWAFPFPIRILAHPDNVHIKSLIKVPWLVFESTGRKAIREGADKERLKVRIVRLKDKGRI